MKKLGIYEWSVIMFFLIVPCIAIFVEKFVISTDLSFGYVAFKWFVFSGIGLRLGSSGLKQIIQPQFTTKEIFGIESDGSMHIVRELGYANICFALIAIISLFLPTFRIPASVSGGVYFGLAGLLHVFKKRDSGKEIFAMISDLFIFFVLLILLIFNIL